MYTCIAIEFLHPISYVHNIIREQMLSITLLAGTTVSGKNVTTLPIKGYRVREGTNHQKLLF